MKGVYALSEVEGRIKTMNAGKWNEEGVQAGSFDAFRQVVAALRAEDGCPWDREQTFESLKPCMINEMTEALAAIDLYAKTGETDNLCEELGDVLLQVVLLSQIAEDEGLFCIDDVIRGISRKMIRRHPHVFGEEAENGRMMTQEVPGQWAAIKRAEKKSRTPQQEQMEKEALRAAADGIIRHLASGNP